MIPKQACLICNGNDCNLGYDLDVSNNYQFYDCPQCGKYIFGGDKFRNTNYFTYFCSEKNDDCILLTDKLQSYMFYHKSDSYILLGNKDIFDEYNERKFKYAVKNVAKEDIENWYPKSINEKIDLILLHLNKLSRFDGDRINLSFDNLALLCFVVCDDSVEKAVMRQRKLNQIQFIIETLVEMEYIKWQYVDETKLNYSNRIISLTARGLARVYDLQKSQANNKKVFIAMSFNPAIEKIYNAIDSAIKQAECEVVSMKHRIHNKQIVPEMLRLIKESKILVMDISEPNFGAYYEAGYAQGLGKEVIFTCKSSVMKQDKFPCDDKKGEECELLKKYSKPHFDIAQKQILVWENEADLTEQLTEWIKFLMG